MLFRSLLQAASSSLTPTPMADHQGYTPLHWACYNGTDHREPRVYTADVGGVTLPLSVSLCLCFLFFLVVSRSISVSLPLSFTFSSSLYHFVFFSFFFYFLPPSFGLCVQDMMRVSVCAGYDACVEALLEQEAFRKAQGNSFSPLHCAV